MSKKFVTVILLIAVLFVVAILFFDVGRGGEPSPAPVVSNFEECVAAGNPILESYPRICRTLEGKTFTETTPADPATIVRVTAPKPNDIIVSPVVITGEARGLWFFEASFPVRVLDENGIELGVGIAQAKSDWMTTNFVPFEATVVFRTSTTTFGTLVFQKDNPSGLPEHDAELRIPIRVK